MTVVLASIGFLVFLSVVSHRIAHCDLLLLMIIALVHLRAAVICGGRAMRKAWQFFCANYGFAVDDVRRDASVRV